jgi:hypothetical protein
VLQSATGPQFQPVTRLDVELWRGKKRLGLLVRVRDLLARVQIGLTGRDPDGKRLRKGEYQVHLVAVPTSGGPVVRRTIGFRIK